MACTVTAKFLGVVQSNLHFKGKLYAIDCVLRGVVEPDLQSLPLDLGGRREWLSGIEGTQVAVCCIDAQNIVGDSVVAFVDVCNLPSWKERQVAERVPGKELAWGGGKLIG